MPMKKIYKVGIRPSLLAAILVLLCSCSSQPDTPEHRIREMLREAEEAVETRSIFSARDYIAERYQDQYGRGKKSADRLISGYILRNKSIHLLTRIQDIRLNEAGKQAEVTLYVGMSGTPVDDNEQLLMTRADIYRFDLQLVVENDQWRVAAASWQPVRPN